MNKQQREARAARLRELLSNSDVQDALEAVEEDIIHEWRKSWTARGRDRKWNELRGFDRLRAKLANYAGHGPR